MLSLQNNLSYYAVVAEFEKAHIFFFSWRYYAVHITCIFRRNFALLKWYVIHVTRLYMYILNGKKNNKLFIHSSEHLSYITLFLDIAIYLYHLSDIRPPHAQIYFRFPSVVTDLSYLDCKTHRQWKSSNAHAPPLSFLRYLHWLIGLWHLTCSSKK